MSPFMRTQKASWRGEGFRKFPIWPGGWAGTGLASSGGGGRRSMAKDAEPNSHRPDNRGIPCESARERGKWIHSIHPASQSAVLACLLTSPPPSILFYSLPMLPVAALCPGGGGCWAHSSPSSDGNLSFFFVFFFPSAELGQLHHSSSPVVVLHTQQGSEGQFPESGFPWIVVSRCNSRYTVGWPKEESQSIKSPPPSPLHPPYFKISVNGRNGNDLGIVILHQHHFVAVDWSLCDHGLKCSCVSSTEYYKKK